jgi:hypothetical protein
MNPIPISKSPKYGFKRTVKIGDIIVGSEDKASIVLHYEVIHSSEKGEFMSELTKKGTLIGSSQLMSLDGIYVEDLPEWTDFLQKQTAYATAVAKVPNNSTNIAIPIAPFATITAYQYLSNLLEKDIKFNDIVRKFVAYRDSKQHFDH